MNDRKRKVYIDYLKAIGIILVVLGHINFANADIKELIYAFHMPLFFFISGLTIKYGAKRQNISPRKFFSKKAVQLLIPYFV